MEELKGFVERLSKDTGCYNHKNKTNYSIKKYNTDKTGAMAVFGWVNETKDVFYVDIYEYLADAQAIAEADYIDPEMHWGRKNKERARGLRYKVNKNSQGRDYQKTVRACRVVMKNR